MVHNASSFFLLLFRCFCRGRGQRRITCAHYYVGRAHTELEPSTDEATVGGESPTHYHLLGRVSWASAAPTAHFFFILGLKSEIVNLQEERITLYISI